MLYMFVIFSAYLYPQEIAQKVHRQRLTQNDTAFKMRMMTNCAPCPAPSNCCCHIPVNMSVPSVHPALLLCLSAAAAVAAAAFSAELHSELQGSPKIICLIYLRK